jgi:TonB-linked SusC/RagA family outer membrane protein
MIAPGLPGVRRERRVEARPSLSRRPNTAHVFREERMMRRWLVVVTLALCTAATAMAQAPGQITGRVTSAGGRILPGATITLLGTGQSVVVGTEGTYLIQVLPGTYRVQARFLGYSAIEREVTVGTGQTMTADFEMTIAPIALEGLVVVGYGTQERRDVTGAVSTVPPEQIRDIPTSDPMKALQGRIPGVDIVQSNYRPGSTMQVRVRGIRSMLTTAGANEPLYVIDGIPLAGNIEDFDPSRIKSIEVLKDASATAIYGSRGANGVVLITTAAGGAERAYGTSITYDTYVGAQQAINLVDMMNAYEFSLVKKEAWLAAGRDTSDASVFTPDEMGILTDARQCVNAGTPSDECPTSNWQDIIRKDGFQQNHQLAINSASENSRISVTANYFDQTGLTPGQGYQRYSGSMSIEHVIGRLRVGVSALGTRAVEDINAGDGIWDLALRTNPMGNPYLDDGRLNWKPTPDPLLVNPLVQNEQFLRERTRERFFGSAFSELELLEGLTWRVNFGPDMANSVDGEFHGSQTTVRNGTLADAVRRENHTFAYTLDNLLTLNREFNGNRLSVTLLYSNQRSRTEGTTAAAQNLPYEQQLWYNLGTGGIRSDVQSSLSEWALRSYMGRVNYTLADKYLFTVTGRWDGSSRLAPGKKWAFFPSVGLGWQLGNESFMENLGLFTNLKLRGSFGRTGNTAINPYQTWGSVAQTRYNFEGTGASGYRPGGIPNPDLEWEKTDQYDVGVEFGMLDNRVSGSIDWYQQNTHDLLMQRQLPASSGFTSTLQNIGETRNTGWEFALSLVPVDGTVRWTMDLNATTNKNEIVRLYGDTLDDIGNLWFIGEPINFFSYSVASNAGTGDQQHAVFYDFEYDGIWQYSDSALAASYGQRFGEIRVVDQNGDGQINADDRVLIGNSYPKWVGSIYNRVTWKWLDLSMLFTYRLGYKLFDYFGVSFARFDGRYNDLNVPYWSYEACGPGVSDPDPAVCNQNPRPNSGRESPIYSTTRSYLNGSHARIRNITVGATLPGNLVSRFGAKNLRLYVTVQEPFIFTSYEGYDPEGGTAGAPPSYRTFLLGANFGF